MRQASDEVIKKHMTVITEAVTAAHLAGLWDVEIEELVGMVLDHIGAREFTDEENENMGEEEGAYNTARAADVVTEVLGEESL